MTINKINNKTYAIKTNDCDFNDTIAEIVESDLNFFVASEPYFVGCKTINLYNCEHNLIFTITNNDIADEMIIKGHKPTIEEKVIAFEYDEWFNADKELADYYASIGDTKNSEYIKDNIKRIAR